MDIVWNEHTRNNIERQIWIQTMQAQAAHGLDISAEVIYAYEQASMRLIAEPGDELEQIARIEQQTKHDLYARLRFFNEQAGHETAHLGLTSADIVENTQQIQLILACEVLLDHAEQLAVRLGGCADTDAALPIVARTHGRPAQLTTLGKRWSDWLCELLSAMVSLRQAEENYRLRGIKGAVGTHLDMAVTMQPASSGGDPGTGASVALSLDWMITGHLTDQQPGTPLFSVGQNYPRGLDLPLFSAALQLAAACGNVCTTVRLMSVLGQLQENVTATQVGSSAMPHKVNPRYSERVHSLQVVARGYNHMLQELAGAQWFEGDVSGSAARRIALPGLFNTVDAIMANTAYVLDHLVVDEAAIKAEVNQWLPFLASGQILAQAVQAGAVRSDAHKTLQHHARRSLVLGAGAPEAFLNRIQSDPLIPLDSEQVQALMDIQLMIQDAVATAQTAARSEAMLSMPEPSASWPGDLL